MNPEQGFLVWELIQNSIILCRVFELLEVLILLYFCLNQYCIWERNCTKCCTIWFINIYSHRREMGIFLERSMDMVPQFSANSIWWLWRALSIQDLLVVCLLITGRSFWVLKKIFLWIRENLLFSGILQAKTLDLLHGTLLPVFTWQMCGM